MPLVVIFIPYIYNAPPNVPKKAALPNSTPSSFLPDGRSSFFLWKVFRKVSLYQTPSVGKVIITVGQCPDAMHVIGQDNPTIDFERKLFFDTFYGFSQQRYLFD
jgi:hypothetical protein